MKRFLKWFVAILVLAGLGALAYFLLSGPPKGAKGQGGQMVEAKVERRDFVLNVLSTGTVKPKVGAQVNVGARQSGKVEKLNVSIGDEVKKDQVIAVIEHQDLEANLQQARALLDSTKVQIASRKLQFDADVARLETLIVQREKEVETERVRLDSIRTQLQATLELEKRKLDSIRAQRTAEVRVASAEIQERSANQNLAQKDRNRYDTLYEKGMLAEQSLDKAKADEEAALSRLRSARQQRNLASTRLSHEVAVQEETVKRAESDLSRETSLQEALVEKAQAILDVTRKELDSIRAGFKADVAVLEASLPRLEAELDLAQIRRSYATVTAPISGTVGTISTQEGETVAAGFSAPTFVTIVDLEQLQVDAYVDEVDIGKVAEGQTATFTVDAFPNEEFKGVVTAIYPTAILRDNVIYYDVVIDIEGKFAGRLRPEMTANVSVLAETKNAALSIPIKALDRKAGTNLVHVKKGSGPPESVEVELGIEEGDFVEVLSGLEEGDTVVYKAPAPQRGD